MADRSESEIITCLGGEVCNYFGVYQMTSPEVMDPVPPLTSVESLADRVKQISNRKVSGKTWFAVAGPPGSGKTTLCTKLADCLNAQGVPTAVLPMDGCVHVYIYIYICTCIYENISV